MILHHSSVFPRYFNLWNPFLKMTYKTTFQSQLTNRWFEHLVTLSIWRVSVETHYAVGRWPWVQDCIFYWGSSENTSRLCRDKPSLLSAKWAWRHLLLTTVGVEADIKEKQAWPCVASCNGCRKGWRRAISENLDSYYRPKWWLWVLDDIMSVISYIALLLWTPIIFVRQSAYTGESGLTQQYTY